MRLVNPVEGRMKAAYFNQFAAASSSNSRSAPMTERAGSKFASLCFSENRITLTRYHHKKSWYQQKETSVSHHHLCPNSMRLWFNKFAALRHCTIVPDVLANSGWEVENRRTPPVWVTHILFCPVRRMWQSQQKPYWLCRATYFRRHNMSPSLKMTSSPDGENPNLFQNRLCNCDKSTPGLRLGFNDI